MDEGAGLALRLVAALRVYWLHRGLIQLGKQICEQILQRAALADDPTAQCRLLAYTGQMDYFTGALADARSRLTESYRLARQLGDKVMEAGVLQPLGMVCFSLGDTLAALGHLQAALHLARASTDVVEVVAALNALAMIHRAASQAEAARPLLEEALVLARQQGDDTSIAIGQLNLSMAELDAGVRVGVGQRLSEAVAIARKSASVQIAVSTLEVAAGWAAAEESYERCLRWVACAEVAAKQVGLQREAADDQFLQPRLVASRQALGDEASELCRVAGEAISIEEALAEISASAQLSAC
jgi:tetratricopeptide (TPR) repeat protein